MDTYILAKPCVECGTVHELVVKVADYDAWVAGEHVQKAFPYVSNDDRELFFISGICGVCWAICWICDAYL